MFMIWFKYIIQAKILKMEKFSIDAHDYFVIGHLLKFSFQIVCVKMKATHRKAPAL